jgi:outer membrane protein assembly factor BamB
MTHPCAPLQATFLAILLAAPLAAAPWPQFRGPAGDGISTAEDVPVAFSESEGVKWKTELPGRGWSSPVFDGATLWMTTAVEVFPDEEERLRLLREAGEDEKTFKARQLATRIELGVVGVDYETGAVVASVDLDAIDQPQTIHALNSFASPTPVLEGSALYCHFGAFGTFAVDTTAKKILWRTRIDLEHGVGPGSSPVIHDGKLVLVCDGVDRQFVTALDLGDGKPVWITERPEMRTPTGDQKKSYNTPLAIRDKRGREQLVCMGAQWLVSYDPANGEEIWRLDHGDGFSVVPRPVYHEGAGLLFVCTGYGKPDLLAIRPDGDGDITGSDKVAWKESRRIATRPSPILVGDEIYVLADGGVASCLDVRTGTLHWTERIDGNYSASPLFADGHLYFASQEGLVTVLKPARTFEVVARNQLDGTIMASPLALDGSLVIRSGEALYRFSY